MANHTVVHRGGSDRCEDPSGHGENRKSENDFEQRYAGSASLRAKNFGAVICSEEERLCSG
jgi:hypothetical protein